MAHNERRTAPGHVTPNGLIISASPADELLEKALSAEERMPMPVNDSRVTDAQAALIEDVYRSLQTSEDSTDSAEPHRTGIGARFRRHQPQVHRSKHAASEEDILANTRPDGGLLAVGVLAAAIHLKELASHRTFMQRTGRLVSMPAEILHGNDETEKVRARLNDLLVDAYGSSKKYPYIAGRLGPFAVGLALEIIGHQAQDLPEFALRASQLYVAEWRAKGRDIPDQHYPRALRILAHDLEEYGVTPDTPQSPSKTREDTGSEPVFASGSLKRDPQKALDVIHEAMRNAAKIQADTERKERRHAMRTVAQNAVTNHAQQMESKRREVNTPRVSQQEPSAAPPPQQPERTSVLRNKLNTYGTYLHNDPAQIMDVLRRANDSKSLVELLKAMLALQERRDVGELPTDVAARLAAEENRARIDIMAQLYQDRRFIQQNDSRIMHPEVAYFIENLVQKHGQLTTHSRLASTLYDAFAAAASKHYKTQGTDYRLSFRRVLTAAYAHELLEADEQSVFFSDDNLGKKLQWHRDSWLLRAAKDLPPVHQYPLPPAVRERLERVQKRHRLWRR